MQKKIKILMPVLFALFITKINAQCAIPPPTGTECTNITLSELKTFQSTIKELLTLAAEDKRAYGVTGRYASAAVNFFRQTKKAYDSIARFNSWLVTGGDRNPAVTSYAEAGHLMGAMRDVIYALTLANWYAQISAINHNSRFASCGREKSLELLAASVCILTYASRCYIGSYHRVPPCSP